jgi:hypothetical protein
VGISAAAWAELDTNWQKVAAQVRYFDIDFHGVLLIRMADPDLAFYLNTDPDSDPGSQTYANPCESGS